MSSLHCFAGVIELDAGGGMLLAFRC